VYRDRKARASGMASGLQVAAALDLLLTGYARGDFGNRLESGLTDGLAAFDAGAVRTLVDALEGRRQPLDALDEPLATHQPHLALLAGLDVVGLVPHAVGRRGRLLQRDGATHLAQPARRHLPLPLETLA